MRMSTDKTTVVAMLREGQRPGFGSIVAHLPEDDDMVLRKSQYDDGDFNALADALEASESGA